MPTVSVVMPAYNRRATIGRAVASVVDQTFRDWELLVVDDGSTDATADAVAGIDPRIRVLRQENRGVYSARNAGLAASAGDLVSFLDSDDEWLPHFLELCVTFLRAHPAAAFVATEFWEDEGSGGRARHDWTEAAVTFPRLARAIGSTRFQQPAPEGDPYLRLYSSREPFGEWMRRETRARVGLDATLYAYRGRIANHFRWGYLLSLWCLVARASAVRALGPFPEERRSATDYAWLHQLCSAHEAHMLSVPSVIKRALPPGSRSAPHLAARANALSFNENLLYWFSQRFGADLDSDVEVRRLLGYRHLATGRAALDRGEGSLARRHLAEARLRLPGWREPIFLAWMAGVVRGRRALRAVYRLFKLARSLARRLVARLRKGGP